MIIPPVLTNSFYSVAFEEPMAQNLVRLLAPTSKDINQAIVTSRDLRSDIEATNELQAGVRTMFGEQEHDTCVKFNPMYLPIKPEELAMKLELNRDGDLQSIDGFSNPYVSAHIQMSIDNHPNVVDAKISFKPFQLPRMVELLEFQPSIS
jgi:hypothetical protein